MVEEFGVNTTDENDGYLLYPWENVSLENVSIENVSIAVMANSQNTTDENVSLENVSIAVMANSFVKYGDSCGVDAGDCFAEGGNFGSPGSSITCSRTDIIPDNTDIIPDNKCVSPKCARGDRLIIDLSASYFYIELLITFIFMVEIVLTYIFCHDGLAKYLGNGWSWIDILATVPSIITIILSVVDGSTHEYAARNYLGSNQLTNFLESGVFKVFRFFKIFKHIPQVSMLINTFTKVADQLLMVYAFMILAVMLMAILFFYAEQGRECFYEGIDRRGELDDDPNYIYKEPCKEEDEPMLELFVEEKYARSPRYGERFQIDQTGSITQFPDLMQCNWFFYVTVTSVGYGDISPVTTLGKIIALIGMLFGAVYIAMPLTLVGGEYYSLWKEYEKAEESRNSDQVIEALELTRAETSLFSKWCDSLSKLDRMEKDSAALSNEEADRNTRVLSLIADVQAVMVRPLLVLC
jgi:hypothetical protein